MRQLMYVNLTRRVTKLTQRIQCVSGVTPDAFCMHANDSCVASEDEDAAPNTPAQNGDG